MSRPDLESLFLSHLPVAEKILSALARRHALSRDAAEEFAAWAKLKIIENDYAVLAKFRGESSLPTYLTVVCAMLLREYRVQQWGRWRPSAVARRNGGVAVRLETLTLRDGLPLTQAAELLRTSGETTLSDRELAAILAQFPRRAPLRPVEFSDSPGDAPADARSDEGIEAEEAAAETEAARQELNRALEALAAGDRLVMRLHYMEDMSVADIARALCLPQKPLYRRLQRILSLLRARLEHAGISRERVRELASGA